MGDLEITSGEVHEIIYGVPVEEEVCFAGPVTSFALPAANASFSCQSTIYRENDFDDIFEILAQVDSDEEYEQAVPAVTASPVAGGIECIPIASRAPIVTYAIPEPYFIKEGVKAQPFDVYADAIDGDVVFAEPEWCPRGLESLDSSLLKTVEEYYQRRPGRTESIVRLRDKKARMPELRKPALSATAAPRSLLSPFPTSLSTLPLHIDGSLSSSLPLVSSTTGSGSADSSAAAIAACNARRIATAKRERDHGKFKKAKTKWVSVTELFKPSANTKKYPNL